MSNIPTFSPTKFRRLHFFCRYYDDIMAALRYLSLADYGRLMIQAILYSIQTVFQRGIDYDAAIPSADVPWRRGGVRDFVICSLFDSPLQSDCPVYDQAADLADNEYMVIGFFGIVADQQFNAYKDRILNILTDDNFRDTFTQTMNEELGNITSRRRLLEYSSFEAREVNVVDPLNDTIFGMDITTTGQPEGRLNKETESSDTIMIIVFVIFLSIVVISIGAYILFRKHKARNDEVLGQTQKEIEMNEYETAHDKEDLLGDHQTKLPAPPRNENTKIEDEGVALPTTEQNSAFMTDCNGQSQSVIAMEDEETAL